MIDSTDTKESITIRESVIRFLHLPQALVGILLLSILYATSFAGPIRRLSADLMPKYEITLSIQNNSDNNSNSGKTVLLRRASNKETALYNYFLSAVSTDGSWDEYYSVPYPDFDRMIVQSYRDSPIAVKFLAPLDPGAELIFLTSPESGVLSITVNDKATYVDLHASVETAGPISVFPFAANPIPFLTKGFLFISLTVLLSAILCVFTALLNSGISGYRVFSIKWKGGYVWLLFLFVYLYCIASYLIGIPYFLEVGDQLYYWTTDNYIINGVFNLDAFARNTVPFRGYLCNAVPLIAQTIGSYVHVDPVVIYFLFTAGASSFLLGFVIPQLHLLLQKKKVDLYLIILYIVVFSIFWEGMYTAILMDLYGVSCLLGGTVFLLRFMSNARLREMILSGTLLAMSVQFRTGYMYSLYLLLFMYFLCTAYMLCFPKQNRWTRKIRTICTLDWRRAVLGLIVGIVMFLAVCIPQLVVNHNRGYTSIIPSDRKGSLGVAGFSLSELSANESLTNILAGYPFPVPVDKQVSSIKKLYTDASTALTLNQLLDMFISRPMNTLTFISKKLFLGFDVKSNMTYPNKGFTLAFSMMNYTILACSLYALSRMKSNFGEKIVFIFVFLSVVLPQTMVHVEWRYFIAGYLFLYYQFVFRFCRKLSEPGRLASEIKRGFLYFLCVFIFIFQSINLTLYS